MTLNELGAKYGTDKVDHGYTELYEQYFAPLRDQPVRLLEIGIAGGASIRMWAEYFTHPKREIWGMDHNPASFNAISSEERAAKNITFLIQDASFAENWQAVGKVLDGREFSIVIDDGAHTTFAISEALLHGWGLLSSDGLWCVEDLHASFLPEYRRDNPRRSLPAEWSADDVIHDVAKNWLHEFGKGQTGQTSGDWKYLHLYKSLAVIAK